MTWKGKFVNKTINQRHQARITSTVSEPSYSVLYTLSIPVVIGFLIGAFLMLMVLRPDLIDWRTFQQSFMNGVIISTMMMR